MEKHFTQQDINQFFNHFKKLQYSYKLEKVHQLINNPTAMAMHRVKFKYKPFKFIIMTSVLIIGLSSLLFWLTPSKTSNFNGKKNGNIVNYEQFDKDSDNVVEKTNELAVKFPQKKPNSVTSEDTNLMERKSHKLKMEPVKNEPFIVNDSKNNETTTKLCEWPIDTTIDKHSLFIYLSNDELLNLGVYLYADSMYYCNEGLIQVFMLVSSQA